MAVTKDDNGQNFNIVLGNSVPAAAVKQRERALIMITGCKGFVGGYY
jgi:hypothetical protein